LVVERHDAVGPFVEAHRDEVDPVVGAIIAAAGRLPATELAADLRRLDELRLAAAALLGPLDVLVVPTTPWHPRFDDVAADPIAVNTGLGRYTSWCNPLDLCAAAIPAGQIDDRQPFGVTIVGPAFCDDVVADMASRFLGTPRPSPLCSRGVEVVVVGAHLTGQPLNDQLTARGGRFEELAATAPCYRLHVLATDPPKPGLVRAPSDPGAGPIEVEVWRLPELGFATFVAEIPSPHAIGTVELADGRSLPGFVCEPWALASAPDITASGGWRRYLKDAP
jgi:allophanate hydrolase